MWAVLRGLGLRVGGADGALDTLRLLQGRRQKEHVRVCEEGEAVLMVGSLFPVGVVMATPAALGLLEEHGTDPGELLGRHQSGDDWGDLCA